MAGQRLSAGRDLRRRRDELRAVLQRRRAGGAVPVRRRRAPRTGSPCTRWTGSSGTATCPASARASATATGCTGPTSRPPGIAATRPSCCSTPTPRRSTAAWTGAPRCSATSSADPDERNDEDSAPHVPRSVVVNPYFDWAADRPPGTPYHESVIYEAHVRGLTRRHPAVPEAERGTYLGMSHPAVIEHLQGLGVTAVELMPVHQFVTDAFLTERGLANYWGYNTIGFFAPHNAYAFAGTPRRAGAGVQVDGPRAASGGDRGDTRRGLQPHRRGQSPGPDAVAARHRQRRVLPAGATTIPRTTTTPPGPATACSCGTRTCCN